MGDGRRAYKVAEKIRSVIASTLMHANDARFSMVTITSVVVSKDLRNAKVYWVVSGDAHRIKEAEEAFSNAGGMLRRAIASELTMRFVPELIFFYDDTLDTVEKVESLMSRVHAAEATPSESAENEDSDEV